MESSGANKGFFQQEPILKNQLYDDVVLQRVIKLFLPSGVRESVEPDLARFGDSVLSPAIFNWITDAERNLPYIRGNGRGAFGKPRSELVVTEGWRKLQDFGIQNGVVAFNYDTDHRQFSRLIQCVRLHLWEASCANTLCPAAMQDGAARLLQLHLANPKSHLDSVQRRVFQDAFDRLTSRDPATAWTSGQWMTERTGGSDVSQTETVATYSPLDVSSGSQLADMERNIPLGPWLIKGFKWFSSATDSGMTILLAKTEPGKGLSAFYAPMRRYNADLISATGKKGGYELNGVNISRMKNKLGTQSLPTAELELAGMRGWLVGEEGKGIQQISTILTVTRVHSTIASLGYLGRGLAIAKSYALVREIGIGKGRRVPLWKNPLHMRTLASITGEYHSMMLLTFFTIYVMGLEEAKGKLRNVQSPLGSKLTPPEKHVTPLLRVLSSVHKAYCCENTIPQLYGCMEALGGVGYLVNSETEHVNVARIFRDACVLAIWEGTTDVLSSDTLRALKHPALGKQSLDALDWFVKAALNSLSGTVEAVAVAKEWDTLKLRIETESQESLLAEARSIVFRIAEVLMALLALVDVKINGGAEAEVMARRFLAKKNFIGDKTDSSKGTVDLDTAIVYGTGPADASITVSKL
ncbi:acyl-CoA dehydrogenase/oxidase C-terminal [Coniochaeta ligniaria NRRL 30616]|uniref:Acyl-CoA dehydrogenase/oxidase C-terminal n=1 Tax=Coniochaeta ligniaria NRRL 30616 TaxID=1408157 RepID=A0A1J7I894_9PEZI|nr:acyl-CoA dehydrogenase/oxidase C-terminal [Coniochaeta ligniaria NRRL 30616]